MNKLFFKTEGWKTLVFVFVFYFIFQYLFFLLLKNFFPLVYYGYESSYFDVITNANKELKELFLNDSVIGFVNDISPNYSVYLENVVKYDMYSLDNKYPVIIAGLIHLFQSFFYCWWIIFSWKNTEDKIFLNYFIKFIVINFIFYVIIHLIFSIYSFNAAFSFKEDVVIKSENNVILSEEQKVNYFKNEDFYFEYPLEWKTINHKNLIFKTENISKTASIVIVKINLKNNIDIQLEEEYIFNLLKKLNNIKNIENFGLIEKNGYSGYYVDYTSIYKNKDYRNLNYRFLKHNKLYIIEFISEEEFYLENKDYFMETFESIKIN